jgi:hypothetical protein
LGFHTQLWIVLTFCLFSYIRGAYELGEQSLWWDESLSHYRATQPFSFILSNKMHVTSGDVQVPFTPDQHPPLYFILLRFVISVSGDSEFAMRFLSLSMGVLVVPLLYQCGKWLFDPFGGVMAALLGALSPLYLWAQQEARPYALGTTLAVTSFYALMRALQELASEPPPNVGRVSVRLSLRPEPSSRAQAEELRPRGAHAEAIPDDQSTAPVETSRNGIPTTARWTRGLKWPGLYALSTAAMLATHYHSALLLPAECLILLLARARVKSEWHSDSRRRRLLVILAIMGIVAGGLIFRGLQVFPLRTKLPSYEFISLGTLLGDVFRSFPLGISGTKLVFFQWAITGLLLAALAITVVRPRSSSPPSLEHSHLDRPPRALHTIYVSICFALPIVAIYTISYVRPAYMNIRHLILASPFYLLLLAAGLSHAQRMLLYIPVGIGIGILLTGMLWSTHTYFVDPLYHKEDHRSWGRYLDKHVRPDDLVLINPGLSSELYFYYVTSPARWFGFPKLYEDDATTTRRLEDIVAQNDRVWLAQSMTPYWASLDNFAFRWLQEHTTRVAFATFDSSNTVVQAHVFRHEPPFLDALPGRVSSLALNFDDQLTLLGLSTTQDHAIAGQALQLSLYWSVTHSLDSDYRVTLSLGDDNGFTWASIDYAPRAGAYPTSHWPVGKIVRDDVDVNVPFGVPPGRYRLNVSVYPADRSGPALAAREVANGQLQGLIVPIGERDVVRPARPPLDNEISYTHRVRRRYGDVVLLGYDSGDRAYRAGDVILQDGYWRAVRWPRREFALSLKLVDQRGEVWATREFSPAGDYAVRQWVKGEVVRGQYRFRIPAHVPAGQYTLYLTPEGAGPYRDLWPWKKRVALNTFVVHPSTDERSFDIPPMQYKLDRNLDDRVVLLGYDLEAKTVRPGSVVSCTLYWRALQDMNQNYTVFNHLVAADGQTWGQWDNQPQRGTLPTTRWSPGQVVADAYQIPVAGDAPAGSLELRVGMYDLLTMNRLAVRDENGGVTGDYVVVTEVEVASP